MKPTTRSIAALVSLPTVLAIALCVCGCAREHAVDPHPCTDSWTFVIFGDTRGDYDRTKTPPYDVSTATGVSLILPQIAAKIASLAPDFVLHVGDQICGDLYNIAVELHHPGVVAIPYDQQFAAFTTAMLPITAANIPLYTVRGNHEVSCMEGLNGPPDPTLAAAYYEALGQYMPHNDPNQMGLTYSFSHKQVTVIAVDQYSTYVPPDPPPVPWYHPENATWGTNFWGPHTIDNAWVSAQLSAATTPFKIVIAHEPIFIASGTPFDPHGEDYPWSAELYFGPPAFGGTESRQQFVDMLGDNGVQLYAAGHVHNMSVGSFTDTAGHTMYQLTAGNGGAFPMNDVPDPPVPEAAMHDVHAELSRPGFTLVTVDPDANTMLMEYYVTDTTGSGWSLEPFTTQMTGSSPSK
jgi:hypothetical protein